MTTSTTSPERVRCSGSDLLVVSVNPARPGWVDDLRRVRQTVGFVDCPECDDLVDTRTEFCNVRLVEHFRPDPSAPCEWTDAVECSMVRERAVAGSEREPEWCPRHGGVRF